MCTASRKMNGSTNAVPASRNQTDSGHIVKPKRKSDDSAQLDVKVRCPCGYSMANDSMIKVLFRNSYYSYKYNHAISNCPPPANPTEPVKFLLNLVLIMLNYLGYYSFMIYPSWVLCAETWIQLIVLGYTFIHRESYVKQKCYTKCST